MIIRLWIGERLLAGAAAMLQHVDAEGRGLEGVEGRRASRTVMTVLLEDCAHDVDNAMTAMSAPRR